MLYMAYHLVYLDMYWLTWYYVRSCSIYVLLHYTMLHYTLYIVVYCIISCCIVVVSLTLPNPPQPMNNPETLNTVKP